VKRLPAKSEPEALLETLTDSLAAVRAASKVIRRLRAKSEPEALLDTVTDSLAGVRGGAHRGTLLKAALIAGGVAALAAGSAGISSLRRRTEANS
jgi:hypothetical protein